MEEKQTRAKKKISHLKSCNDHETGEEQHQLHTGKTKNNNSNINNGSSGTYSLCLYFLLLFSVEGVVVVAFMLLHGHFCSSFNSSVHFFIYSHMFFFSRSIFFFIFSSMFVHRLIYIMCTQLLTIVVRSVYLAYTGNPPKKAPKR